MEDFNGPLDLILHLLSKNRMEIKDIQISLLLDQYLEWMDQRKRLDLEVASEFVTMAAHLVFIKTRMLLSIHDEEAISEMEQLIASLEEHQRHENFAKIKAIVPELSDRYAIGRDYIPKVPEALPVNRTYRYVHKPEDLLRAMTAVLARVDHRLPPPMAAPAGLLRLGHFGVAIAGEIHQVESAVDQKVVDVGGLARCRAHPGKILPVEQPVDHRGLAHVGAAGKGHLRQAIPGKVPGLGRGAHKLRLL